MKASHVCKSQEHTAGLSKPRHCRLIPLRFNDMRTAVYIGKSSVQQPETQSILHTGSSFIDSSITSRELSASVNVTIERHGVPPLEIQVFYFLWS